MKCGAIFFGLLFVTVTIVCAQPSAPVGFDANANLANANSSMFRSFDNRYSGVKGHPTVFEDFVYGNVNMKNGERAEGQELNYDAMANELIVRSRIYKKVLAVRSDLVESFELINSDGDTLVFKRVVPTAKGFCQVVYDGKMKVYLKYGKEIARANHGGAYNSNARTYDEFTDANVYLLSKEDGEPLQEVKPTRKAFEARFPEKSEVLRKYLKQYKPDLKNPKELIPLLEHLEKEG